jgi:hypothetical protein
MVNQATPHLKAWPSLRNNKSSNHYEQPRMGIALVFEWKASTQMNQINKNK